MEASMQQPQCPLCLTEQWVSKAGHNSSGSQRHWCQQCQRYFTPDPKPNGYTTDLRKQVYTLHRAGLSLRAIGQQLGINHQTVNNWLAEMVD
jgi:transposase-like protein